GVDPEMIEALGIAGGDVSGYPFIESKEREQAEGPGQALLAVPAFLIQSGNGHGRLLQYGDNYNAAARTPATRCLTIVADYPFCHANWLFPGLAILAL